MLEFLASLTKRLQCAHLAVYAPVWHADLVEPVPQPEVVAVLETLTRELLWWMAREHLPAQTLNRMRMKSGGPLLPYRALLYPLQAAGSTVGLVAAIRTVEQAPFTGADSAVLGQAVLPLQGQLAAQVETPVRLSAWRALDLEVVQRFQEGQPSCVVYADLDHMHAVNDVAGFQGGDGVLHDVAYLWRDRLLPEGSAAVHLSGDRYAAVLFNHTVNQARTWADRVRERIAATHFPDIPGRVTVSVGLAELPDAQSLGSTLAAAETACRVAKERGRDRVESYVIADATIVRRRAEVRESRDIADALAEDRLVLHAQPIVSLVAPGRPSHFEILLRVKDDDGQLVSVSEYLAAADRYQLLERLDRWVLLHVLERIAPHAQQLLARGVRFAVNVTGQSLSERGFADFVRTTLKQRAVPGDLLVFECTEAAAMRNLAATVRFIDRVTELGARVALDDFGTGVSSLMHLKELAVQQIKIDGRFTRDVIENPRSDALVRALVLIAERLELQTVAEYVETERVAARLRTLGVQCAQGYLYGRPGPLAELLPGLLG
ncbi:MAG: bifunctional diguanylate cyclase/phosphodiesterase [Proteobacteria bacterium]|nr:bifunctional diguanylate cyclase/phosphodiesterase [Pseudomonadota bacterium]